MIHNQFLKISILTIFLVINNSCYKEEIVPSIEEEVSREGLTDWSETTHGNSTYPAYDVVFPQDKVNRIDLVISSENWQAMLDDIEGMYGPFGQGGDNPPPPQTLKSSNFSDVEPIFVPCSFHFDDKEWYNVGVRFKGNSSLSSSWRSGNWKIPFKIKMDEFEDDYPEITNQRFYGFKKLSLSSNYDDMSLLREKVAADIFRDAGINAPYTAFYRMYVDFGDGPIYFGLYTMCEVVEDTMLENQFGSEDGNCYKPENQGATFANGTFSETDFEKKTNEDIADWSDITDLFEILHSSDRTINAEQWRTQLELVFNVNAFLKWLAVNTVIQNWDTYGVMNHNYYIYNDPENNLITWIPWDNNEALQFGKQGGALSISLDEVTNDWPLISYLINDDVYSAIYKTYVAEVIDGAFEPSMMKQTYQELSNLIEQYVTGTDGEIEDHTFLKSPSDFAAGINELMSHVDERYSSATNYLNSK